MKKRTDQGRPSSCSSSTSPGRPPWCVRPPCPKCPRSSSCVDALRRHLKGVHGMEAAAAREAGKDLLRRLPRATCRTCGRRVRADHDNIRRHLAHNHGIGAYRYDWSCAEKHVVLPEEIAAWLGRKDEGKSGIEDTQTTVKAPPVWGEKAQPQILSEGAKAMAEGGGREQGVVPAAATAEKTLSSSSAPTEEDIATAIRNFRLPCPDCKFSACRKKSLKSHGSSVHKEKPASFLARASANFVAITCKRCYTLQPAWETNFKLHLLVCGGNNGRPSSSSRSSPDSLLRSYTEEDFGRAVPLGATALGGGDIFQVADYYRSLNPASNLTLPAVLGMVAARLGAEMCEDCGLAVLARDRVRHGPNCISKHGKARNSKERKKTLQIPPETVTAHEAYRRSLEQLKVKCQHCERKLLEVNTVKHKKRCLGGSEENNREFKKMSDSNGLIACRVCHSITKRTYFALETHCKAWHDATLFKYFQRYGDGAFRQTRRERRVSSLMTRPVRCPECGREVEGGLEGLRDHLRAGHRFSGAEASFDRVLVLLDGAGAAGLRLCAKCGRATFEESKEEHESKCRGVKGVRLLEIQGGRPCQKSKQQEQQLRLEKQEEQKKEQEKELLQLQEQQEEQQQQLQEQQQEQAQQQQQQKGRKSKETAAGDLGQKQIAGDPQSSLDKRLLPALIKAAVLEPKCPWCQERFHSVAQLKLHAKTVHSKEKGEFHLEQMVGKRGSIPCALCGAAVQKEFHCLKGHLENDHGGAKIADYLGEYDLGIICGHQSLGHPLIMRQCPWCGLGCKSMGELREHAKDSHEQDDYLMFLLKWYHIDWKASCTLCKQPLALEYKEIEQHAISEHKCPMHMFLELFYNKMKEEFEEQRQKEHQNQQRQQQQQHQQHQQQQQQQQEEGQQQEEQKQQQQQQHDSCQLQYVMKPHQTGVPQHSKDEEKQRSQEKQQQKHTEKQHCNKGLKKQRLKHQEQQKQKEDQHQQEEVFQPHQKGIQEAQKEHQQKSRIVAVEQQELLQSEDAQQMLQRKTPSMESTNLNISRGNSAQGDIRRSGRLSRKRKLVEEEEDHMAEAKVLVERLSQRLITKLEKEGLKVRAAAPIASGGAMCHRETEKEEKREGNSGEEGRMRAKTARGTKEKGEENMETEKDNNEKTRFSEEDGKEEKAIAGIAIAQREAETVEKDLELPLSIGIKSESNDDGEENGAGLSIVSVTSLSCCQQKGDHKELAECFDLDDFSVNGLEDQGRAPAFGSREVFACPQCGVDSKYFSSLMDVSEHVREIHS